MSTEIHRYRVHGLTLHSEIAFPELIPDQHAASRDVEVILGAVPATLPDPLFDGARAQGARGAFLLRIPGVGGYHLATRSRIIVEPNPDADAEDVRTFFLSSVMGALIHAHGRLPLHASAIRTGNGCILLAGASGSGKSTLAGEFVRWGSELVSDDLTTICIGEDGEARAQPGYRALRLWGDTLRRLTGISSEVLRGRTGHERRTVVVGGVEPSIPLPIRGVYILRLRREGEVAVRHLRGAEKTRALIEQTYRMHLLPILGSSAHHYRACLALARRVPVYQIDRPAGVNTVAEIAREIATREEMPVAGTIPS